jgi:hypothetical protein
MLDNVKRRTTHRRVAESITPRQQAAVSGGLGLASALASYVVSKNTLESSSDRIAQGVATGLAMSIVTLLTLRANDERRRG